MACLVGMSLPRDLISEWFVLCDATSFGVFLGGRLFVQTEQTSARIRLAREAEIADDATRARSPEIADDADDGRQTPCVRLSATRVAPNRGS